MPTSSLCMIKSMSTVPPLRSPHRHNLLLEQNSMGHHLQGDHHQGCGRQQDHRHRRLVVVGTNQ